MVSAHFQTTTDHIRTWRPDHPSRRNDPHYKIFRHARRVAKEHGKLVCWICGSTKLIEAHHTLVEYSLANGVDITKFEESYPEFKALIAGDHERFLDFVEGPGNLTYLCKKHHTGEYGIHRIPEPLWTPMRFWKDNLPPPAVVVPVG